MSCAKTRFRPSSLMCLRIYKDTEKLLKCQFYLQNMGGGLGNQTRVMKHPNSLTKGNNDTLAALRTLLWALVQTQRAIFGCSVSAGVQLYFTLLWRCTERLLEGEWLAVVHFTAPLWQTNKEKGNLRRKSKSETQLPLFFTLSIFLPLFLFLSVSIKT